MRLLPFAASLLLAVVARAHAEPSVELTPIPRIVKEDGASRKIVEFRCRKEEGGRSCLSYTPPWPITGAGDRATMTPKDGDAMATIRTVQTRTVLDLTDSVAVKAWVSDYLPPEAEKLLFERGETASVQLNGQAGYEVTVSYAIAGLSTKHSIFLIRRSVSEPNELFLFELTARPKQFRELHEAFRQSLHSIVGF